MTQNSFLRISRFSVKQRDRGNVSFSTFLSVSIPFIHYYRFHYVMVSGLILV